MADFPAMPQAFTFGGRSFLGTIEGYAGRNTRRAAIHEVLKRAGARVEDMERGPRTVDVRLVFLGEDCAKQYADFVDFVDENPFGLLVHPTVGKFNAFCTGPNEEVNLATAINRITVRCSWIESNIDAPTAPPDIPKPPAAAQQVTAQQTAFEQMTAAYMGQVAQAQGMRDAAVAQVQSAIANIGNAADPIKEMRSTISTAVGTTSAAVGAVASIQTQGELLSQDVSDLVSAASDIFDGEDEQAGGSDGLDTLLGAVVDQGKATSDAMLAASPTPAGAVDAVSSVEELVASCYVLREALRQALPPTISYTVPETTDVVTLCVKLFPNADAFARASVVLSMNRIPNPAVIRKGTVIRIPSR